MICKCGFNNKKTSKYCEGCGKRLKKCNKSFIYIGIALLFLVIVFISLALIFNKPTIKVEKELNHYYMHYNISLENEKELEKINKILVKYENDKDMLMKIKDIINKEINSWEKEFNIEYKNAEELDNAYKKIYGAIEEVYKYFNGFKLIEYEDYNLKSTKIYELYKSKNNYLKGINAKNEYDKYYYFQKIVEDDVYYKKVIDFINNYVSGEIESLKKELEKFDVNKESLSEKYNVYLDMIKYLYEHKKSNNIDLANSSLYKDLYNDIFKKLVDVSKKYLEELVEEELLNKTREVINNIKEYKPQDKEEIDKLIEELESIIPISLLDLKRTLITSNVSVSKYGIMINNKEYGSYIAFGSKNKEVISYNLNKEYTTLKFKIVNNNLNGNLIVYSDDKKAYETSQFNEEVISINVKDVKNIKIEYNSNINSNENLYLIEPYLYK